MLNARRKEMQAALVLVAPISTPMSSFLPSVTPKDNGAHLSQWFSDFQTSSQLGKWKEVVSALSNCGKGMGKQIEWSYLLQLGRSNGWLSSTISNIHPWIYELIGKKLNSTFVAEFMIND